MAERADGCDDHRGRSVSIHCHPEGWQKDGLATITRRRNEFQSTATPKDGRKVSRPLSFSSSICFNPLPPRRMAESRSVTTSGLPRAVSIHCHPEGWQKGVAGSFEAVLICFNPLPPRRMAERSYGRFNRLFRKRFNPLPPRRMAESILFPYFPPLRASFNPLPPRRMAERYEQFF